MIFAVGFWGGWTDELVEGTFIDPNTGEDLFAVSDGFHPFHPGIVVQGWNLRYYNRFPRSRL